MLNLLPKSLQDIASAIGEKETFALIDAKAGERFWIPNNPPHDWVLFEILGREAGYKLAALCGGNQIEIPVCRDMKLEARNQQIRKDRELLTVGQLAKKYALRRNQIHRICNVKNAL